MFHPPCKKQFGVLRTVVFSSMLLLAPAKTEAQNFVWKNIEIGHGGHCDYLYPHPLEAGLMYARSDVNGAYKMTNATGRWKDLLSQYFDSNSDTGRGGVAMAVNPKDKNTLFIARHALHRSKDGGQSWVNLLNKHTGNKREHGESIAVDPNNPNRVYYGTMTEGLWFSNNEGGQFSQVPSGSIPFGDGNPGVTLVQVDPTAVLSGNSRRVYVGVFEEGLFWSNDAGVTWSKLTAIPTGIARIAIAPSGIAYITRAAGGVYRFDPSSATVTNITPSGLGTHTATAITVRHGTEQVLLATFSAGRKLYRATNPTAPGSWTYLQHEQMNNQQPWVAMQFWGKITAWFLASDPHNNATTYFGDDFALWESDDVWTKGTTAGDPIVWTSMPWGFENTVSLDLQTPPTGTAVKLLAGMRDVGGFRITNPDAFPNQMMGLAEDDITGLQIFEGNANDVAFIAPDKFSPFGHTVAFSSDGGQSWQARGKPYASNQLSKTTAKFAMASNDKNKLVALSWNQVPRYSTDGGWNWQNCAGLPTSTPIRWPGLDWTAAPIDNDKAVANRFYLHYYNQTGFWRSDNGGANWTKVNSSLPANGSATMMVENTVRSVPGRAGEVWVALRSNGLWRSTDAGANFTQVTGFQDARLLAFGAPEPGSSIPTAYVHGKRGGDLSVYMSKDNGVSWVKILKPGDPKLGQTLNLAASRTEFGRVYVGTRGLGLFQGLADGGNAIVPQPSNSGFELGMNDWLTSGANPEADYVENGSAYEGSKRLVHWKSGGYTVTTYQTVAGLPSGTYSVEVWTKNAGWGTHRVFINGHGGSQQFTDIPRNTTSWQKVVVPNINVTSGQMTISLFSNETTSGWVYYDAVKIIAQP